MTDAYAEKRRAMALAIQQDFDNERGYGVGHEANEHVLQYWRLQVEAHPNYPDFNTTPGYGSLIHEAFLRGNSMNRKRRS